MSIRLLFWLLLTITTSSGADFIRQIQKVNGNTVTYDLPVTGDSGEVMSKPIPSSNATFQLYTSVMSGSNSTLLKLDEKTVGTYVPAVTVQILSEDPAVPARTRADKPYGVTITVSGMSIDPAAPASARQVQMRRSYALYDPDTRAATTQTAKGEYLDSFEFHSNGSFTSSSIIQQLPVERPTQAMGEESFKVYTHPDASSVQGELAAATIKIWPVATAEISGIENNRIYGSVPTTGKVNFVNLYPKSSTFAHVYKGPPALGILGTILPSTVLTHDTTEPQSQLLVVSDLANGVTEDGQYTLEVLTMTPFNGGAAERLAQVTFTIKQGISINGAVTTLE